MKGGDQRGTMKGIPVAFGSRVYKGDLEPASRSDAKSFITLASCTYSLSLSELSPLTSVVPNPFSLQT
jgi:hypothetical protein